MITCGLVPVVLIIVWAFFCPFMTLIKTTSLQIQVYLNNKDVRGTLKHYDLRYNVAVIEVIGSCSPRAMELEKHISFTRGTEVVAVGCLFEHQKLMASRGVLINGESKLNCKDLKLSTCSITKVCFAYFLFTCIVSMMQNYYLH